MPAALKRPESPLSGASQYHGHGQLMLTHIPVPSQTAWDAASRLYASSEPESLPTAAPRLNRSGDSKVEVTGGHRPQDGSDSSCSASLAVDLLRAHRACGLLRCCQLEGENGGHDRCLGRA